MDGLNEPVTIPRAEYQLLLLDAGAWRLLNTSPHVAEILSEWIEWAHRKDMSESTAEMARMVDWRREASVPTYAVLRERRSHYERAPRTPEQIRAETAWSWARVERALKGAA
ncbi:MULTISPECIES: hypothetical protein [Amycolatopsis]|uniref:hypothetical protein n=1 Tax=Amycolatopsis TaxID=1813 RepID=UPI000B8AB529|nr:MULTISPECIES: hypothetical protein [Amycolatopsis]OXM73076.1 hypothetical protein CF166_11170 [Amycolatopsis sp. KNN50.9b]